MTSAPVKRTRVSESDQPPPIGLTESQMCALLAASYPLPPALRFDQAGCFRAAGIGVFKPALRANRSARNRAVFSLVAAHAASYSAIACRPSCSCCSFFLKAASARSRARLASVSNLVTPSRANPLAGQTSLPEGPDAACRCGMLNRANAGPGYFVPLRPTDKGDPCQLHARPIERLWTMPRRQCGSHTRQARKACPVSIRSVIHQREKSLP
jgi:hypothetical protein